MYSFILFSLTYLIVSNWHLFLIRFNGFTKKQDLQLSEFIRQKTGIEITTFYIVTSDLLFGGMTGIPTKPIMSLSSKLYHAFSKDELHYIALHETGHYALKHILKEALLHLGIILLMFFLSSSLGFILAIVCGVVLGCTTIQIARMFEWQADTYALQRLDNPLAMISATKKLQAAWGGPLDNSLIRKLFYRGIPYSQRISYAQRYMR